MSGVSVGLGVFDGVHLGHRQVIESAVHYGAGLMPVVLTFADHPREVLTGEPVPKLVTNEMRITLFEKLGVQTVVMVPFHELMGKTPKQFFEFLENRMKAEKLCFGFNYHFGRGGEGDAGLLADLCEAAGVQYEVIPPVKVNGVQVSSTLIREKLSEGDLKWVSLLLGRRYSFSYIVQPDKQVARTIGYPTINQQIPAGVALPKFGVYASESLIKGERWPSITNVGKRPTVHGRTVTAETHIFDFEGELYGEQIEVELTKFVREEKKFDSVEELRRQIIADMENVHSGELWLAGLRKLWYNTDEQDQENGGNSDD